MKTLWGAWLLVAAACGGDSAAQLGNPAASAGTAAPTGGSVAASAAVGGGDTGVVQTSGGSVQGDVLEGLPVRRFLKIPYAKPPLGPLRWMPPQKPDAWSGVRHEAELSKACSQNASSGSKASLNEDCLYLNVWQPIPKPEHATVMVWIHGGGNFAGGTDDKVPTSDQLWFDGKVLAQRHGIVVVTLNYRLGPLGFFGHKELAAEGGNVGNQGLLDQNFALQWVHDNIAAFGGDPGNVTIFGESAGSADVCYHVASPRSKGLFQRAISQSGGCTQDIGREQTPETAQSVVQAFAKALGCESETGQLACLREKPIEQVMQSAMQPDPMAGGVLAALRFSVLIDGPTGFLPKPAREIFDAGELNRVPYILGSNSDEGTLFLLNVSGPANAADYTAQLQMRYGDFAPEVERMYPSSKFNGDARAALARVIGDSGLVCGTHDSARRAAKAGLPVFMYNFNMPWAVGGGALGAAHASEISSVFGTPFMPNPDSQTVSDEMNAYWARFAKTGDPNGAGAPSVWPAFAPDAADADKRQQFDPAFAVLDSFRKDECAFWRARYEAEK